MKKMSLVLLTLFMTEMSFGLGLFEPILIWPAAKKQQVSRACLSKINAEIQKQRTVLNYPVMGSLKMGEYASMGGVHYYEKLSAHKILLKGVVYRGSDFVFSADILVPLDRENHYFEYWKGQLDSPTNCKILKVSHVIDQHVYSGVGE